MISNPVFQEAFKASFHDKKIINQHRGMIILFFLVNLVLWPEQQVLEQLILSPPVNLFFYMLIFQLIIVSAISLVHANEINTSFDYLNFEEWVSLSPGHPGDIIQGKMLYHLFHSFYICIISFPLLILDGLISGFVPRQIVIALVSFVFIICGIRMVGNGFHALMKENKIFSTITGFFVVVLFSILSYSWGTDINPLIFFRNKLSGDSVSIKMLVFPGIFVSVCIIFAVFMYILRLLLDKKYLEELKQKISARD